MPGLTGFIGHPSPENKAALGAMVKSMVHERFYTSGSYIHEQLGVWLGWVSHEGSFSDCLPIWNETKDICLVLAGEEFADQADIARLKAKGHSFKEGDASYLVHMYEEFGLDFIEKLNGWFCG